MGVDGSEGLAGGAVSRRGHDLDRLVTGKKAQELGPAVSRCTKNDCSTLHGSEFMHIDASLSTEARGSPEAYMHDCTTFSTEVR
jgi:hypothetical protein